MNLGHPCSATSDDCTLPNIYCGYPNCSKGRRDKAAAPPSKTVRITELERELAETRAAHEHVYRQATEHSIARSNAESRLAEIKRAAEPMLRRLDSEENYNAKVGLPTVPDGNNLGVRVRDLRALRRAITDPAGERTPTTEAKDE